MGQISNHETLEITEMKYDVRDKTEDRHAVRLILVPDALDEDEAIYLTTEEAEPS